MVRSGPKLDRLKIMLPKVELKKGKKFLISYVGVIGQQEGIDHLLEAIEILINDLNFKDFYCIICGGGPALDSMKSLASEKTWKILLNLLVEYLMKV